jgi:hypothetical protein
VQGVLGLGVDFGFAHGGHVKAEDDDGEDAADLDPGELGDVEAHVAGDEGEVGGEDVVADDALQPEAGDEADDDTQDGSSDTNPDEVEDHVRGRTRIPFRHLQEQHEEHHSSPIIQQTLALNERIKPHTGPQILQQRHHSHRIGRRQHTPQSKRLIPRQLIIAEQHFEAGAEQDGAPEDPRGCQDQDVDDGLAEDEPVAVEA